MVRSDVVWQKISSALEEAGHVYDGTKCKNKFSALKAQYTKVKDHNKNRTGSAPMLFSYQNLFDDIFANDHIIEPIALASSLNPRSLQSSRESGTLNLIEKHIIIIIITIFLFQH